MRSTRRGVRLLGEASIGVIGAGNMGSALVKGWIHAGKAGLLVWDKYGPAVERLLAEWGASAQRPVSGVASLSAVASLEELAAAADTLLVVVKPKDAKEVLSGLGRVVRAEQTVVSAMAGLTLEWLRDALGPGPALLRVMPNLAVEVGAGAVAVAVESGVAPAVLGQALDLFRLLGLVEVIPEELFDVVTAVSGSSPAFLALAVEGLEDGAVAAGLSRLDARRVVRQAALETARQLAEHSDSPAELRQHLVATGQVTTETLEFLEERRLRLAFRDAVAAAMERSRQMHKV
jgi:pyrroline-5-carboxylate reductase